MDKEVLPEEQNLSVTRRPSGKFRAKGYGQVTIPPNWVFIDPGQEDTALIDRIWNHGPCWRCYEQISAWYSRFKGYYAPRSLIQEERAKLEKDRDQWLQERKHENSNLVVYEMGNWKEQGVSEPSFGRIPVPEGWDLLQAGDPLLTRRVKGRGKWWEYCRAYKTKSYDLTLGIFAPVEIIQEECKKVAFERTTESYKQRLQKSRKTRRKKEAQYTDEFKKACFQFLNFAPEYEGLAWTIAEEAAALASEVGSGRVGRTSTLTLEEKAELATRAFIRHNFTNYDEGLADGGELKYREIKGAAGAAVTRFIEKHRGVF